MKSTFRSLVSCFLCVLILFFLLPAPANAASASGACGDNASWSLNNGILTISGTGETWDFYDDKPRPWEKWKDEIRQVVVNEGITAIGAGAFFIYRSLERATLPDSLISIGNFAFYICEKLSVCELPPRLEHLGQDNFAWSAMTSATIPASVTFMDGIYQYSPNLETVYIEGDPDAPGFVYGSGLFGCCPSLRTIEVEEDHIALRSIDGVLFSKSGKTLVALPGGYRQRTYRIPSGTEEIFQSALDGDRSNEDYGYIRRLIVPDSVSKIGRSNDCRWAGELHFEGDAPAGIEESLRLDSTDFLPVTVYYPKNNSTWTEVMEKAAKHEEIVWIEEEPLTVTGLTVDKTAAGVGEPITWTAAAVGGIGTLKYAFRVYKDGTIVQKGTYSKARTFTYTPAESGTYQVRAYVKDASGTIVSKTSSGVTAAVPPAITTQPANKTVEAGAAVTFKVAASGTGLSYQWQYSKDNGGTWKDKTGAAAASYTVTAKASYDGIQYRCVVTNAGGSVTSDSAKLTVTSASKPEVTTQPKAQTAAVGETATFTVTASGTGLKYQWQYSSDYGKTWNDKPGSTKATHTVTVKASYNGMLYRCKVTNSAGTVTSSKVRLTVSGVKPRILSQPAARTAAAGESVTFKVVAAGVGMTYQWQYSFDGTTWKNKSGATSASYTVTAKSAYNGILYRCVVTNSNGSVNSASAKLMVS